MKKYHNYVHYINSCKYHFVWCPKYRHPVLNVVEDDMRELFDETADHFGHDVLALEIADDHVHLSRATRSTALPTSLGSSSRTRASTCWNITRRFVSRISGVADSGKLGATWE